MSFTNFREKNAKRLFALSVGSHLPREKKDLLFLLFPAFLVLEKKIFSEMRWTHTKAVLPSPHFLQHHHDGSLFFDSGSAREQSRFCKQGTINMNARCLDSVLFRLLLLFCMCARAANGRVHERDNFLCKILSSLPVHERNTLLPKARKRGYKTHSFTTKRTCLAMWTRIFLIENERASLDLAFGSRIVDFTSV